MSWIEAYRSKLTTADKALEAVRSGYCVFVHQGCGEPEELVQALVRRGPDLRDVDVIHMATMGSADYTKPEFEGHFRHQALFIGANAREAVQQGRADYIPIFLHEIEGLFRRHEVELDVALIQCAPPDEAGRLSLGTSIDIALTAVSYARHVIVEVNDQCPRTLGNSFIHVNQADAIVECSHPVAEYRSGVPTEIHHAIAQRIADMIPDGATIQTGIGEIPESVLLKLGGHRDLGIHSEMMPDGVVALIQSGVVNNKRKTIHRDKAVAGFVLGTKLLFDFIHENPVFEFHPTSYVNDPFIIGQNERMVAINGAIEVDLTGQVCSDSIGSLPYSGIGGQVDFIRGAARSKGGMPIIALPSTVKGGTVSRIVPVLKPGAGVVTSRGDVHYVVTEHGVAYLHGKSVRRRAEAMLEIAAPRFREELLREARRIGLLR